MNEPEIGQVQKKAIDYDVDKTYELFMPVVEEVCKRYGMEFSTDDLKALCMTTRNVHETFIKQTYDSIDFLNINPFRFIDNMHADKVLIERDINILAYAFLECRNKIGIQSMISPTSLAFSYVALDIEADETNKSGVRAMTAPEDLALNIEETDKKGERPIAKYRLYKYVAYAHEIKLSNEPYGDIPVKNYTPEIITDIARDIADQIDNIVKSAIGNEYETLEKPVSFLMNKYHFCPLNLGIACNSVKPDDFNIPVTYYRCRFGLIDRDGKDCLTSDSINIVDTARK